MKIPLGRPYITKLEHEYVNRAMDERMLSGDREWTKRCSELLRNVFGISDVLLTTSCSTALDMTALLLELKEGDEVIMPSYNFVSMANSVVMRGATPVFVDIDSDTLTLSLDEVERHITPRTKAIYPVHYAGISCDMDRLLQLGEEHGIAIVEDAAQAVNAKYKGNFLGTLGDMGCYSFHETKNYTCGEGGAILVNKNPMLMQRAEIIREKGTNRSQFFRGQVDKYTWVDIGSSFLPSDLLAALLCAQIENHEENLMKRHAVYERYKNAFSYLEEYGVNLPTIPVYSESNYHIFYLMMPDEASRNGLMEFLQGKSIGACFHYIPLHSSPFGRKHGVSGPLPVTNRVSQCILRLPLYAGMLEEEQEFIIAMVRSWFKGKK